MGLHKGQSNNGSFKKGHIPWNKNRKMGEEIKAKIRQKLKGKKNPEHSLFMKKIWTTPKYRNKVVVIHKKRMTKKMRKQIANSLRGGKLSEETKRKIGEAEIGDKHWNWQGGLSFGEYSLKFTSKLKEKIRKRDNYTCQKCGKKEKDYYRKLDIHHIDYNKKNCNINNLITICQPCNVIANTNRDYWFAYYTYIMEN